MIIFLQDKYINKVFAKYNTGWAKKVIPLVQFQNTQTLTVNKLNIQR